MIEINHLTKKFGTTVALKDMNCSISEGTIWGLAGSNGSGKSTLLRTLSGVYAPDEGEVIIDGECAYDNHKMKERCFFISDYPFFFNDSTVEKLASLYRNIYATWNEEKFLELCQQFPLKKNQKIINMSKGMQRQAALIFAFSIQPKYLFLDEIFDGLDPVIRKVLKTLIINEVSESNMTCMIASHNLREIDDICDKIILLHEGNLVRNEETDELKNQMHKVQIAFQDGGREGMFEGMDVQIIRQVGGYYYMMIKGDIDEIMGQLQKLNPSFIEVLPATLEEVFINEMEEVGYGK